jgi:hypothetical protein
MSDWPELDAALELARELDAGDEVDLSWYSHTIPTGPAPGDDLREVYDLACEMRDPDEIALSNPAGYGGADEWPTPGSGDPREEMCPARFSRPPLTLDERLAEASRQAGLARQAAEQAEILLSRDEWAERIRRRAVERRPAPTRAADLPTNTDPWGYA